MPAGELAARLYGDGMLIFAMLSVLASTAQQPHDAAREEKG